jgi:hypothetical protein
MKTRLLRRLEMTEDVGKMTLAEWKTSHKFKEEYRKICAAEDALIRQQMLGITPVKKTRKKKSDE